MFQRQNIIDLNNNTSDTTNPSGANLSLFSYGFDTNNMIAAFAVILLSSTVFSYLFKSWTIRAARKNGEPPLIPYTIPWLGHGVSFMWNINLFVKWVRWVYGIKKCLEIENEHWFTVKSAKHCCQSGNCPSCWTTSLHCLRYQTCQSNIPPLIHFRLRSFSDYGLPRPGQHKGRPEDYSKRRESGE